MKNVPEIGVRVFYDPLHGNKLPGPQSDYTKKHWTRCLRALKGKKFKGVVTGYGKSEHGSWVWVKMDGEMGREAIHHSHLSLA